VKNKNVSTKTIIAPICTILLLLSTPSISSVAIIDGQESGSLTTFITLTSLIAAATFFGKIMDEYHKKKNPSSDLPSMEKILAGIMLTVTVRVKQHPDWRYQALIVGAENGAGIAIGSTLHLLWQSRKTKQEPEKKGASLKEAYLKTS